MTSADQTPRSFTLTWILDAPPETVFGAWTDPERMGWYHNPTQPIPDEPIELDLRVGGAWRQHMVISESTNYVTGGVYREVVPNEKLVFAWGATGGWPELDPVRLDDSPLVTVLLSGLGGRTELMVTVELPASLSEAEAREWFELGIRDGWRDTVDRLAAALADAGPAY